MRSLLSAVCIMFATASCSACNKPEQVVVSAPPPVVVPSTVVVSNENLSVMLPNNNWMPLPVEGAFKVWRNAALKNLVLLSKEPTEFTNDQFALYLLRSVKDNGGTVVSTKQSKINGSNFLVLETLKSVSVDAGLVQQRAFIDGDNSPIELINPVSSLNRNPMWLATGVSMESSIRVFMWLTVDKGYGYIFSCGGPSDVNQTDLCTGISTTVKIN